MKNNEKIVRYRKRVHINIGVVVFAFVLIYFLIYVFSYLTADHIAVYEVQNGQIAQNTAYTGLILRTEEIRYADESGDVNYYKKEKDKAGYNDIVCSIDKNGDISKEITAAGTDGTQLEKDALQEIQIYITDYTKNHTDMQFYNVYSFKDSINAQVQEDLYLNALDELAKQTDTAITAKTFSFIRSKSDGILAFYTDGYESVTPETFEADMYAPASYIKTNLKNNSSVASGDALYKMVTNEYWNMMIPITEEEKDRYQQEIAEGEDSFIIYVIFKKDNTNTYATAHIDEIDNQYFLVLDFNNSMVRFLSERYLEVELGAANVSGLKIPNSSITEKEFLVIPKEYVGKGDNSSSDGVLKVTKDKKNNEIIEFIATDLYYETDTAYYVDEESLAVGDSILMQGSSMQYTISDTAKLQGVYNINKGYAVFDQIDIIAQNEEYSIVQTGTAYGISLYDHIALDGTSVNEGDMVN